MRSDVSMKTIAAAVVRRVSRFPAPLAPKNVWLAPPKMAPSAAAERSSVSGGRYTVLRQPPAMPLRWRVPW